MGRRHITSVVDQQHRLRELGRIRFGERKNPKSPGRPLEFARVSSQSQDVIRAIAETYGGTPQEWQREEGAPMEWDVKTEGPLAIACAPGIVPYTSAFEQWAAGYLTVRCDGQSCQFRRNGRWVERACVCAERDQDYNERPCKQTTRMTVMVLGVPILGVFRMETKSYNATAEVPATLALLQQSGRAAWLQMRRRTDKVMAWDEKTQQDKPLTRHFWVITVDAPFMPDEVMAIHRPASMDALPAPTSPALGRGERPQIGPGSDIAPTGPQPGDREEPPAEPIEVLDPDEALADAIWEETGQLPVGGGPSHTSAPGDA